ncbi:MAG: fumarylacetoacetate hydrolase family protein [Rhodobiaceae bacterium]|nr:fumarylacetoacetate hydrolase family protein [Rhodobiaceae bacterium]
MSDHLVFAAPPPVLLPIAGRSEQYPVNRIFCVGRNYAEHAKEMGFEVDREAPFYFTKPASAYAPSGGTIAYPPGTQNCHYEMELVVALGGPAYKVSKDRAMDAVFGYACGLDMTRRDLQIAAREKGRPWDLGKAFENSAVIAPLTEADGFGPLAGKPIELKVNGETKQNASLDDLIWSVPELISHLSGFYHLKAGDLIFTGTPAGVGPVKTGDKLIGTIDGCEPVEITIGDAD